MTIKTDTCKLPFETIEEKSSTAKELRKSSMTRAEIGQIVGIHADTVGKWLKLKVNEMVLKKRGS